MYTSWVAANKAHLLSLIIRNAGERFTGVFFLRFQHFAQEAGFGVRFAARAEILDLTLRQKDLRRRGGFT